jgi:biopolymer transport protein ExbD
VKGEKQKVKHFIFVVLTIVLFSGNSLSAEKNEIQLKKQPEIQQVKPHKPVKIKLHRTAKGEYSWDLTGDSVDEIVKADKRLRILLKVDQPE